MEKKVIRRYLSQDVLDHVKEDLRFLVKKVVRSGFEYDLQLRDDYLNLHYKGNGIGKISYLRNKRLYKIEIHKKFVIDRIEERFKPQKNKGNYFVFLLPKKQLHPLFSSANLLSMGSSVKKVNYQEETTFEQMLMTDNVGRLDLIIIDRQVVDKKHRTKMDLLALAHKGNNDYQFIVLEVKLGNNPELRGDVIGQLEGYRKRISDNFSDYKKCYLRNFIQKQELGLMVKCLTVNIVPGVLGLVVVGGYSGMAEDSIKELKRKAPNIRILQLKNIVDLSKAI